MYTQKKTKVKAIWPIIPARHPHAVNNINQYIVFNVQTQSSQKFQIQIWMFTKIKRCCPWPVTYIHKKNSERLLENCGQ